MLFYRNGRLELDLPEFGKPLFIDFEKYPRQNVLLKKAVGKKPARICDLSAGLGKDAWFLYSQGYEVELVERSSIIAQLLEDGLQRANCTMKLFKGEAKDYLALLINNKNYPDVIYFDPIFPEKSKTALSQKSARILKAVVGTDEDSEEIFQLALKVATKRVVIKRPLHGKTISDKIPDLVFKGKSVRFDVYLL